MTTRACALIAIATLVSFTPNAMAEEATTGTAVKKPLIQVKSRPCGTGNTMAGLDVLKRDGFKMLHGKRIALLTNTSAIDREGNHILDLLSGHSEIKLVTLFAPEHGLYGNLDTKISDFQDTATGLMVRSLYSNRKDPATKPFHPRMEDLKGLDAV